MPFIDKYELKKNSESLRADFGLDQDSPLDIFNLVSTRDDYTLIFRPLSVMISGMCINAKGNKLIVVNSANTEGRQRFTVAHELYHLNFQDKSSPIICDSNLEDETKPFDEKKADIFASFFLVPSVGLSKYIKELTKEKKLLGLEEIILIEQRFKISRSANLVRLESEGHISKELSLTLMKNVQGTARYYSHDISLYKPSPIEKQRYTTGKYITLAKELFDKELISSGKYRELMTRACRADLLNKQDEGFTEIYD